VPNKPKNLDDRLWLEPTTKASNEELYPLVALGCEIAREKIILANKGLVIFLVERFLIFMPGYRRLRDELIQAGMVSLVETVDRVARGLEEGSTQLFSLRIQRAIGETIEADGVVPVPESTSRMKRVKGESIGLKRVNMIDPDGYPDNKPSSRRLKYFAYDPRGMQAVREMLEAACEDDTDREIMRLREEGYVDREIANVLGLSLTTVYVMRRAMYARFLELSGWKGEA